MGSNDKVAATFHPETSFDESNIPRYVLFRGKKARVTGYEDGKFHIIDNNDLKRFVSRAQLTFLPEKPKKP